MDIRRETPDLEVATRIAASGFVQPISSALEADVAHHLTGDQVYTLSDEGKDCGFAIFNQWDKVLYLGGIILDETHQRHGVFQQVAKQAKADSPDQKYLALRTQSIRMWLAGSRFCWSWYPEPPIQALEIGRRLKRSWQSLGSASSEPMAGVLPFNRMPTDIEQVGLMVAERLGSSFPVHTNCYGGPLYGQKPTHHNQELQDWWDSFCQFERGDAIICVGQIRPSGPIIPIGTGGSW